MEQYQLNQLLLAEAMDLYYEQYNPTKSIEKIDQVLKIDKISFAYSLKATILKDTNLPDKAIEVINEGLGHNLRDHALLKLKAEMLAKIYLKPKDALYFCQQAKLYFEASHKELKAYIETIPGYDKSEYLLGYLGSKTDLQVLEAEINSLADTMYVLERAENIGKQLISERVRTVELLGLFTAIVAFIFSSVHIITRMPLVDALVLEVGIALLLIVFLLALHMVSSPEARTKTLIGLLLILCFVLFALPIYAGWLRKTSFAAPSSTSPAKEQVTPADVNAQD